MLPFVRFALDRHFTAVLVHDFRNDRQAEADALRLGGEKRIEDVLDVLGGDAGAAVDHRDFGHRFRRPGLDGDGSAGRGRLRGVQQQVEKNALHQVGVERNRTDLRGVVSVDGDIVMRRTVLEIRDRLVEHLRQVGGREAHLHRPREIEETRETSRFVRSTSVEMKPATSRATSFSAERLPASISAEPFDGAERISQLVRQARRELPQGRQPLGAPHGGFGFAEVLICHRQLLSGHLELARFLAGRRRQRVGQVSGHGEDDQPQEKLLLVVGGDLVTLRINVEDEREIRPATDHGE